jgi:hypothetical protein
VAFATCTSCHLDAHGAQLPGTACESCHSDLSWQALRYDRTRHATTTLPLEGRHATLACADCHATARKGLPALPTSATVGTAGIHFRLTETRCAACHADPHLVAGEVRRRDTTLTCGDCHSAAAFRPSTIGLESHARFAFPLEGAHRAVPCRDCHSGLPASSVITAARASLVRAGVPLARVPLGVPKGTSCASCHQTPHGTQFDARPDRGQCEACHRSDRFAGALRFDHERQSAFSLKGAHATVACDKCHRRESVGGTTRVIYRPLSTSCESCHTAKPAGGVQ